MESACYKINDSGVAVKDVKDVKDVKGDTI